MHVNDKRKCQTSTYHHCFLTCATFVKTFERFGERNFVRVLRRHPSLTSRKVEGKAYGIARYARLGRNRPHRISSEQACILLACRRQRQLIIIIIFRSAHRYEFSIYIFIYFFFCCRPPAIFQREEFNIYRVHYYYYYCKGTAASLLSSVHDFE